MIYRRLGSTALNVSVIGLGGASLGGVYQRADDSSGIKTVHRALELGINFIDVSPYYGKTKAEHVLGQAIQSAPISREKFYIATKVGRYDKDSFDFSAKRVTESVHESLSRLNCDYIDLIQCHDIEFVDLDIIVNETIPALYKLKESGLVKNIGITGFPLKIFRGVIDRLENSPYRELKLDTVLSYCHYSLNNTTLANEIPYLQSRGMGIINASALSMGLLTHHGAPEWHPASKDVKEICKKAVNFCSSKGEEIEKMALEFALANNDIDSTLVGTASIKELENNIQWAKNFFNYGPSNPELLAEIQAILKPIQNKAWSSGLPENNDAIVEAM